MNKERGRELLARCARTGAVDEAFASVRGLWDDLLSTFEVDCPDEHARRMANVWNPYQCMATFNLSPREPCSRRGSAAAWASATRTRTSSASST